MDPYELGGALWRQRLLVVLVFLATALAIGVGVVLAPKSYTAAAVVRALPVDRNQQAAVTDSARSTLGELANSSAVAAATSDRLAAEPAAYRSAAELRRSISGEWREGSALIEITVTDRRPEVAARIAEIVASDTLSIPGTLPDDLQLKVVKPARVPTSYSSPDLPLVSALGLLLAVVAAGAGAILRDRRRATVDNGRVAEAAALAPLLAHVEAPTDPTTLPALAPGTAAAETFRMLRSSVEPECRSDPVGAVVVAGIGTGESSVWVGANLAISLASSGRRVLLVDARLEPHRGAAMAESPGDLGLFDVLGGAALADASSPGPVAGLSVLPAGETGGIPTKALLEAGFAAVVDEALAMFDAVVVLAPPMDATDDARFLASDRALVLAISERTVAAATLHTYADRSRSAGSRLLGVVLVSHGTSHVRA